MKKQEIEEIFSKLISTTKWYKPLCISHTYATMIKKKFYQGNLSLGKMLEILYYCGYEIQIIENERNIHINRIKYIIKEKADMKNKTPLKRDFNYRESGYIERFFGTYNNALKYFGYKLNQHEHSRSELLNVIKQKSIEIGGKSPKCQDFDINIVSAIQRMFGTYNNALKECKMFPHRANNTTKEEAKASILKFIKRNGYIPRQKQARPENGLYGRPTYYKVFGVKTWAEVLEACGVKKDY